MESLQIPIPDIKVLVFENSELRCFSLTGCGFIRLLSAGIFLSLPDEWR